MFKLTPFEKRQLAHELSVKHRKIPPGDIEFILDSDIVQTAIQKEIDNQVSARILELSSVINFNKQ